MMFKLLKIALAVSFINCGHDLKIPIEQGINTVSKENQEEQVGSSVIRALAMNSLGLNINAVSPVGRYNLPVGSSSVYWNIPIACALQTGIFALFTLVLPLNILSVLLAAVMIPLTSFGIEFLTKYIECKMNGFDMPLSPLIMSLHAIEGVGTLLWGMFRRIFTKNLVVNIVRFCSCCALEMARNGYKFPEISSVMEIIGCIACEIISFTSLNPMIMLPLVFAINLIKWSVIYYSLRKPNYKSERRSLITRDSAVSMFTLSVHNFEKDIQKEEGAILFDLALIPLHVIWPTLWKIEETRELMPYFREHHLTHRDKVDFRLKVGKVIAKVLPNTRSIVQLTLRDIEDTLPQDLIEKHISPAKRYLQAIDPIFDYLPSEFLYGAFDLTAKYVEIEQNANAGIPQHQEFFSLMQNLNELITKGLDDFNIAIHNCPLGKIILDIMIIEKLITEDSRYRAPMESLIDNFARMITNILPQIGNLAIQDLQERKAAVLHIYDSVRTFFINFPAIIATNQNFTAFVLARIAQGLEIEPNRFRTDLNIPALMTEILDRRRPQIENAAGLANMTIAVRNILDNIIISISHIDARRDNLRIVRQILEGEPDLPGIRVRYA